jgi:hypothetical protein
MFTISTAAVTHLLMLLAGVALPSLATYFFGAKSSSTSAAASPGSSTGPLATTILSQVESSLADLASKAVHNMIVNHAASTSSATASSATTSSPAATK